MGYDERDVARNKTPEHQWERYYNLKPGDVYVEAGAYLCRYGRIASRKVGSGGRVILIEPSPRNVEVIKEVIDEMNLGNVILVEKAVWSEKGTNLFRVDGNRRPYRNGNYAEISMMLEEKGYRVIKVWGGVVYAHVSRTTQS